MKQTIGELVRHVWQPPLGSYYEPHAEIKIPCQQSYDQGWNAAMSHLKAVGKI